MLFPLLEQDTAPAAAKPMLAHTQEAFGMIPNLERILAHAPTVLEGYSSLWALYANTSLSAPERQVVMMTVNVENDCGYCVPWHTLLAKQDGLSDEAIAALRAGDTLTDRRLEALRQFTLALMHSRGKVTLAAVDSFIAAGYTQQQVLEVIMGIALKTISNFTNSVAGTPLDKAVKHLAWEKPTVKARAA